MAFFIRSRFWFFIFICFIIFSGDRALSQPCDLDPVKSFGGIAFDAAFVGQYAYIAGGSGELLIVDVTNPTDPVFVNSVSLPEYAGKIVIHNDRAYVLGDNRGGFVILDISNPSTPLVLGSWPRELLGSARDIEFNGDLVFVSLGQYGNTRGIFVFDVSDPTSIKPVSDFDLDGGENSLAIYQDYLFVASGFQMRTVDVSDPANPIETGSLYLQSHVGSSLRISESGVVCLLLNTGRLALIDAKTPFDPIELGSIQLPVSHTSAGREVRVVGDIAYVCSGTSIHIVDISEPSNPVLLSVYTDLIDARDMDIQGEMVCLADGYAGMKMLNISNPKSPYLTGSVDFPAETFDLIVRNDLVYIADGRNGMRVVDMSNSSMMSVETTVDFLGVGHTAINQIEDIVYVTKNDKIQSINVSNPLDPVLVDEFWTSSYHHEIAVYEHVMAVTHGFGVIFFDVSNPYAPFRYLKSIAISGDPMSTVVIGDFAYVADGRSNISVVYLGGADEPVIVASHVTPGAPVGASVVEGMLYVVSELMELLVYDLSNPIFIRLINSLELPHKPVGISVADGVAAVMYGWRGVSLVDITDPASPALLSTHDTREYARAGVFEDDSLYIADREGGVMVFNVTDCQNVCLADFTGDGSLNFFDVSAFLIAFTTQDPLADFTDDMVFNFFDVSAFLQSFGEGCP